MNNQEIEKRYKVSAKALSSLDLSKYEKIGLTQAYLSNNSKDSQEVRVREVVKEDKSSYVMTIKSEKSHGGSTRTEIEFGIDKGVYEDVLVNKLFIGNKIIKDRYLIPLEKGLIAELDVFKGELKGLVLVEVEFKSHEEADKFTPPKWFGSDITENIIYCVESLITKSYRDLTRLPILNSY